MLYVILPENFGLGLFFICSDSVCAFDRWYSLYDALLLHLYTLVHPTSGKLCEASKIVCLIGNYSGTYKHLNRLPPYNCFVDLS